LQLYAEDPDPHIEILGTKNRREIPRAYLVGSSHVISGDAIPAACSVVAALSRALDQHEKVAICKYFKTAGTVDPVLGALFPFGPNRLVFIRLPYAGDTKCIALGSLDCFIDANDTKKTKETKATACDNLIDAMMLPEDFSSKSVPNPMLGSWYQTVIKRALGDPEHEVVTVRGASGTDPMKTPPEILQRALPAVHEFRQALPLSKSLQVQKKEKKANNRKRIFTYRDYVG
jgi:hypothetical protein